MKLNDLRFAALLPRFLREDPVAAALADIVDGWVRDLMRQVQAMATWNTALLPEAALDELAASLGMFWYRLDADAHVKRTLIDGAVRMYRHMGTPWAVEQIAIDYFGDAVVQEWFDTGAEPYHFQVRTGNVTEGTRAAVKFRAIVEQTKNLRSYLDAIVIETAIPAASAHVAGVLRIAKTIRLDMEG